MKDIHEGYREKEDKFQGTYSGRSKLEIHFLLVSSKGRFVCAFT